MSIDRRCYTLHITSQPLPDMFTTLAASIHGGEMRQRQPLRFLTCITYDAAVRDPQCTSEVERSLLELSRSVLLQLIVDDAFQTAGWSGLANGTIITPRFPRSGPPRLPSLLWCGEVTPGSLPARTGCLELWCMFRKIRTRRWHGLMELPSDAPPASLYGPDVRTRWIAHLILLSI